MAEKILPLTRATDVRLVGGKAAALARLLEGGFNVPDGFVVTTLAGPKDLQITLESFDKLDAQKIAVRSSAVAEDGAKDAWAGQLDTFLNVPKEELIDKIQACLDSANSERIKAYSRQKGINPGQLAVIVQRMVAADISGVAFSIHPVTNNRQQIVVESVLGLGEKLVSGTVTPDTYVIDRSNGEVLEQHLAAPSPSLDSNKLKQLIHTVIKIEEIFGFPVDVEWSFSNQKLYILQSRPITTVG